MPNVIRARQRSVTAVSPHNANSRFLVPSRPATTTPFIGALAWDGFNRADGDLLGTTAPTGQVWEGTTATGGAVVQDSLQIVNGSVVVGDQLQGAVIRVPAGAYDIAINFTPTTLTAGRGGIVFRETTSGNMKVFRARAANSALDVLSISAGTIVTDQTVAFTFEAGRRYTLRVVDENDGAVGGTVTFYIDGVEVMVEPLFGGQAVGTGIGMVAFGGTPPDQQYDNLRIYAHGG